MDPIKGTLTLQLFGTTLSGIPATFTPDEPVVVEPPPVTVDPLGRIFASETPLPFSFLPLGPMARFGNFRLFGPDDWWYRDTSKDALDTSMITVNGVTDYRQKFFNATYGPRWMSSLIDMPYNIVDSSICGWTAITLLDPGGLDSEGDVVMIPLQSNCEVEGDQTDHGADNHLIIFDRYTGFLFEIYNFWWKGANGGPTAGNIYYADATKPLSVQRPYTFSSSTASGSWIFMGIPRPEEIEDGFIDHATRCTGVMTNEIRLPATHAAPSGGGQNGWAYGMRLRLADDAKMANGAALGKQALILQKAWETYGLIPDDIGGAYACLGGKAADWDVDDVAKLQFQQTSLLELQDVTTPLVVAPPVIKSFVYLLSGGFAWEVEGDANCYVQGFPPTRNHYLMADAKPGTYRLVAQNYGGRVTRDITVS